MVLFFVLFCFVFVFMISLKPRPFVKSFFDRHMRPDSQTCFFFLFFFFFPGNVAFSDYFVPITVFSF